MMKIFAKQNLRIRRLILFLIIVVVIFMLLSFYKESNKDINITYNDIKFLQTRQIDLLPQKNNIEVEKIAYFTNSGKDSVYKTKIKLNIECQKWVIITTINEPTEHVKYLHDALFDWCLVVLGDSKSPPLWHYKEIKFLSLQDQIELSAKYKIVPEIPTKSYLRKMVGYLYAIEHGARFIYETDDDNSALDGLLGFRYEQFRGLEANCEPMSTFINPYAYFGQPTVWPRGYPLEMISERNQASNCSKYKISTHLPLVQQGLVNGDPDVDAIYRLTRKSASQPLYIEFDSKSPPLILSRGQYAPTNSQNTLFHYNAFWTLIFPRNVTFREVDILRGYIYNRMLQEIDGRISFMAPNAIQIRNAHSYHKDFLDEKRLYESILRFVNDLKEWKCGESNSLKECFIECIQMLIEKKHLSNSEISFYSLWIQDLDSIGYVWPQRQKKSNNKNISTFSSVVIFKAIEQQHSSNANQNEESWIQKQSRIARIESIKNVCQIDDDDIDLNRIEKLNDVVLVTWISSLEQVEALWHFSNLHFEYVVGCFSSRVSTSSQQFDSYLKANTSGGLILVDANSFSECVFNAINIGFKMNTFIFAKNSNNFAFWLDQINFVVPNVGETLLFKDFKQNDGKNEYLLEKNVYLMRKTVTNGQRIISNVFKSSFDRHFSYCSFLNQSLTKGKKLAHLNSLTRIKSEMDSLIWHSNDLVSESCSNVDSRTIWIPDVYEGPRIDIATTLAYLGQNPILAGLKTNTSTYSESMKFIKISKQLSKYILDYPFSGAQNLLEANVKENFYFYKNSSDFANVDAVVCSLFASMCEAFIPLNKTIIFNPANQYNIGRCSETSWTRLNENYKKLRHRSKLVVSSMSRYNEEYQAHFVGMRGFKLWSHGTFYAKRNGEHNPTRQEILIGPYLHDLEKGTPKWLELIRKLGAESNLVLKSVMEVYPTRYETSDLVKHPAIVIIPNDFTIYLLVELYASNVPLFVPSIDLLISQRNTWDTSIYQKTYCGNFSPIKPDPTSKHGQFDPNSDNETDLRYWIKYGDYYQWPFVTVFESWIDLINKLKSTDLKKVSVSMKAYNKIRQAFVLDNWCRLLKSLPTNQAIPKTYDHAIDYFKISNRNV